jgi:hypothetical protein
LSNKDCPSKVRTNARVDLRNRRALTKVSNLPTLLETADGDVLRILAAALNEPLSTVLTNAIKPGVSFSRLGIYTSQAHVMCS